MLYRCPQWKIVSWCKVIKTGAETIFSICVLDKMQLGFLSPVWWPRSPTWSEQSRARWPCAQTCCGRSRLCAPADRRGGSGWSQSVRKRFATVVLFKLRTFPKLTAASNSFVKLRDNSVHVENHAHIFQVCVTESPLAEGGRAFLMQHWLLLSQHTLGRLPPPGAERSRHGCSSPFSSSFLGDRLLQPSLRLPSEQ